MSKKNKAIFLPIRKRIVVYLEALNALGYNQKEICDTVTESHGWKLTTSALTKSKCIEKEVILEKDYIQKEDTLLNIQTYLGLLLLHEIKKPDARNAIQKILEKHQLEIDILYADDPVVFIDSDERAVANPQKEENVVPKFFSIEFCNLMHHDFLMKLFKRKSPFVVWSYMLVLYFLLPYTLAILLGKWDSEGYGFSESNTMLFAYPISSFPIACVFVFYRSIPFAFIQFGKRVHRKVEYQELLQKAFAPLPRSAKIIWMISIIYVVLVHIGYLLDDIPSFLESDQGVPNALYFLNILLYTWHVFMFLYTIIGIYTASKALRRIAADTFLSDSKILKVPQPIDMLLPLGRPLVWLLVIFGSILMYALFFSVSMYKVSQEAAGGTLLDWQAVEMTVMFLPIIFYLWISYLYVKPITQFYLGTKQVAFKDCKKVFIYLIVNNLVFLPKKA